MIVVGWNVWMCGAEANQSRQRPGSEYSSLTTQRLKTRDDSQQEGRRQRSLRGVKVTTHTTTRTHETLTAGTFCPAEVQTHT